MRLPSTADKVRRRRRTLRAGELIRLRGAGLRHARAWRIARAAGSARVPEPRGRPREREPARAARPRDVSPPARNRSSRSRDAPFRPSMSWRRCCRAPRREAREREKGIRGVHQAAAARMARAARRASPRTPVTASAGATAALEGLHRPLGHRPYGDGVGDQRKETPWGATVAAAAIVLLPCSGSRPRARQARGRARRLTVRGSGCGAGCVDYPCGWTAAACTVAHGQRRRARRTR